MCAPATLTSIARLCATYPNTSVSEYLPRILPHSGSAIELKALLTRFGLDGDGGAGGAYRPVGLNSPGNSPVMHEYQYGELQTAAYGELVGEGRLALLEWDGGDGTRATTPVALGSKPLLPADKDSEAELLSRGLEYGTLADLSGQSHIVSALLQDHSVGMDACLLGGKGSGKTAIARRFAATLGYTPRTVYCYADLPARDLLQRQVQISRVIRYGRIARRYACSKAAAQHHSPLTAHLSLSPIPRTGMRCHQRRPTDLGQCPPITSRHPSRYIRAIDHRQGATTTRW